MAINMHMEGVDVGDNDNNGVSHSNNQSERPQNSDNNAGPSRSTSKTSKSDSDIEGNGMFQCIIYMWQRNMILKLSNMFFNKSIIFHF